MLILRGNVIDQNRPPESLFQKSSPADDAKSRGSRDCGTPSICQGIRLSGWHAQRAASRMLRHSNHALRKKLPNTMGNIKWREKASLAIHRSEIGTRSSEHGLIAHAGGVVGISICAKTLEGASPPIYSTGNEVGNGPPSQRSPFRKIHPRFTSAHVRSDLEMGWPVPQVRQEYWRPLEHHPRRNSEPLRRCEILG